MKYYMKVSMKDSMKDYMKEKSIRMVVDKKSLLLADQNLDITNDIIEILNKKLKSINLNLRINENH